LKATVNTSVLIALGKLGYLRLVKKLFDKLVIAESVFEEVKDSEVFEQVNELINDGFARVARSTRFELLNMLALNLGKGEAETIALALEIETDVAMLDDLKARKLARRFKMKIVGTLGVIKALIDAKLVKENPESLCERLIEQGFWIDRGLCLKVLRK
jgi:hypothetical protein